MAVFSVWGVQGRCFTESRNWQIYREVMVEQAPRPLLVGERRKGERFLKLIDHTVVGICFIKSVQHPPMPHLNDTATQNPWNFV
jgi:hypothetical protein